MSEREENVYKAKLAEQAERYDGEYGNTFSSVMVVDYVIIIEPGDPGPRSTPSEKSREIRVMQRT